MRPTIERLASSIPGVDLRRRNRGRGRKLAIGFAALGAGLAGAGAFVRHKLMRAHEEDAYATRPTPVETTDAPPTPGTNGVVPEGVSHADATPESAG